MFVSNEEYEAMTIQEQIEYDCYIQNAMYETWKDSQEDHEQC